MGTAETNNKLKLTDKVCRRELKTDSEDQKAWRFQTYIKNENEISMEVGRRRGVKLVTCRGNEERKRARHKTLGNCTRIPNTHFRSKVLLQQKKAAQLYNPAKFLYMLKIMISCRLLAPWSIPIYLHQTADVKLIRNWAASKCALKFSGTHWASGCWEYPAAKRRVEKKEKYKTQKLIQLHHQMGVVWVSLAHKETQTLPWSSFATCTLQGSRGTNMGINSLSFLFLSLHCKSPT